MHRLMLVEYGALFLSSFRRVLVVWWMNKVISPVPKQWLGWGVARLAGLACRARLAALPFPSHSDYSQPYLRPR